MSSLQLWVAACLYRGVADVHALLHGRVDDAAADAVYRECSQLGTTLQVPEGICPADRAAFERYRDSALREIRIDPPVRELLRRLMMLEFLPCRSARRWPGQRVPDRRVPAAVPRADAAGLDPA